MDFTGFYHDTKSACAYAVDIHNLHIRLRTGRGAAAKISLMVFDPHYKVPLEGHKDVWVFDMSKSLCLPMALEYSTSNFDWWFTCVKVSNKHVKYAFMAENDNEKCLYANGLILHSPDDGEMSRLDHHCFTFPYLLDEDIFRGPEWVKDTAWYQVFPERFANSGSPGIKKPKPLPWGSRPEVDNSQHYGGDLLGVTSKLQYLADMGFKGIYMTPIFIAPSIHKYDTEDYFQIDPAFGDNAIFSQLISEAHRLDIKVMLDMVFNHMGSTHPFWLDVLEKGRKSRYFSCFYFEDAGGFEAFARVKSMPKWNTADPFARKYLLDAAAYWARTYAIDGFRLDVANEVSHDFWREFRKAVHAINPDIFILGEVWEQAMPWLQGEQFHSVTNYRMSIVIWDFVSGKIDGAGLKEGLSANFTLYPKNRQPYLLNLVGSHDTSRIMTVAKNRPERVMQAFALIFTFAGSPCVLYGDEAGLTGEGMDKARKCMVWDEEKQNLEIKGFIKQMLALREAYPAMKAVDVKFTHAGDDGIVYVKESGGDLLAVLLNCRDAETELPLPDGWAGKKGADLLNGRSFTMEKAVRLKPYGCCLIHRISTHKKGGVL